MKTRRKKQTEWSYWKGKLLSGQIIDLQSKWVSCYFPKRMLNLIKQKAGSFVEVPPGRGNVMTNSNPDNLLGNRWSPPVDRPIVWARKGKEDWKCLSYATASVLHFLGDTYGATFMKEKGDNLAYLLKDKRCFSTIMDSLGYMSRRVEKMATLKTCKDYQMNSFCIGQVCGSDGGTEHVIGIVDNWIFDSSCETALPLCDVSLNQCCSNVQFRCFTRLAIYKKKFNVTKLRKKVI
jgi:hypothetical protein